ncbi:apolipoprotein N-acyltransferase [Roseateles koreensis]|uniref:Apolipoprotein N-acyltransferase n=1 Tax=Roseateles koreensis TaxID=2987526 RepID=A0ABT5KU87_9BURK|nr:apolipoprotein N-acyltransferase [Roseateles koreensis]MDC8786510.1 apolipoprotein N-acyltransferase [Roseateles koreensis]
MRARHAGFLWALLAALALGGVHTAAFAPTYAWWAQLLALAGLARLSWHASPRRAAALGVAFSLGWLCCGLWWLHISMHQFGHIPAPLSALAVLLLALFLSCYYAAALAVMARLSPGLGVAWRMALWAAAWGLAETGRATGFGGFPWIASGYAHTAGPLAAWAPWIGVYGISALAAAAACALAAGLQQPLKGRAWTAAVLTTSFIGVAAYGLPRNFTQSTGPLRASLLQPNVPQDQKFDRELIDANLDRLAVQIESARGQVVITPESVAPVPVAYLDADYVQRLQQASTQRPLLLGTFLGDDERGYTNSLIAFGTVKPYDYGKRHLLPFGEFIPTGFHWFVKLMGIPMDDQLRGPHQRAFEVAGQRLRPLICYEDLFGEDFVDSVVGPDAATVLVNVSNLAWFGDVMVQDQHLQFSQMRALEFQRPFIRATNTGATAALDHRGQVTARLTPSLSGVLEVSVEGRVGSTPYARWLQAFGLTPLWVVLGGVLLLAMGRRRQEIPK